MEDEVRQVGLGKVCIILSSSCAIARAVFDLPGVEVMNYVSDQEKQGPNSTGSILTLRVRRAKCLSIK